MKNYSKPSIEEVKIDIEDICSASPESETFVNINDILKK